MEIDTPLVMKRMSDLAIGELLVLDGDRSACLAVCIRNDPETTDVIVGLLDAPELTWPYIITQRNFDGCGSYGSDWFIELVEGDETLPYNGARSREHYGTIFVKDSAVISFGPNPQGGHLGGSFELPSWVVLGIDNDSIPYRRWKIWRSRQAYEDGKGFIREITARAPQPR